MDVGLRLVSSSGGFTLAGGCRNTRRDSRRPSHDGRRSGGVCCSRGETCRGAGVSVDNISISMMPANGKQPRELWPIPGDVVR